MTTDQRAEALRLAKEAGFTANHYEGWEIQRFAALIALARASAAPQEPVVACHLHRYSDRIECVYGGEVLPADWRSMPKKYTDLIPLGQSVTFYAASQPQAPSLDDVRAALANARYKALEEAAKLVEQRMDFCGCCMGLAPAIRELRTTSEK